MAKMMMKIRMHERSLVGLLPRWHVHYSPRDHYFRFVSSAQFWELCTSILIILLMCPPKCYSLPQWPPNGLKPSFFYEGFLDKLPIFRFQNQFTRFSALNAFQIRTSFSAIKPFFFDLMFFLFQNHPT